MSRENCSYWSFSVWQLEPLQQTTLQIKSCCKEAIHSKRRCITYGHQCQGVHAQLVAPSQYLTRIWRPEYCFDLSKHTVFTSSFYSFRNFCKMLSISRWIPELWPKMPFVPSQWPWDQKNLISSPFQIEEIPSGCSWDIVFFRMRLTEESKIKHWLWSLLFNVGMIIGSFLCNIHQKRALAENRPPKNSQRESEYWTFIRVPRNTTVMDLLISMDTQFYLPAGRVVGGRGFNKCCQVCFSQFSQKLLLLFLLKSKFNLHHLW